jgi:hypothetical protein
MKNCHHGSICSMSRLVRCRPDQRILTVLYKEDYLDDSHWESVENPVIPPCWGDRREVELSPGEWGTDSDGGLYVCADSRAAAEATAREVLAWLRSEGGYEPPGRVEFPY